MAKAKITTINKGIQNQVLKFGRLLKKEGLPIDKLIIFGSYAKNKATEYSDIDVCVVSPTFGKDSVNEMQFLFKERRKIDTRIEPYPASLEEYNNPFSQLMGEIKKYGFELSLDGIPSHS